MKKKKAFIQGATRPEVGTADFSKCDKYRYQLTRTSMPVPGAKPGIVLWIMLNPSTATHIVMDPTVTRCWLRTQALGYTAMTVVNLFAFRSTSPKVLYGHSSRAIGPKNDKYILENAKLADIIVCAWGNHGNHLGRSSQVLSMLLFAGLAPKTRHLGLNKNGEPKHPLYVSFATKLKEFK